MGSSMLIGFNNDVEFNGRMFHIQTEDHGIKDGHITTILFFNGQILESKKISYQDVIKDVKDEEERKKAIKKKMVDLHREFYKKLFDGIYEERVDKLASGKSSVKMPTLSDEEIEAHKEKATQVDPEQVKEVIKNKKRPTPPPLKPAQRLASLSGTKIKSLKRAKRNGDEAQLAFRGIIWPDKDLRLDGLVAEFLESQA